MIVRGSVTVAESGNVRTDFRPRKRYTASALEWTKIRFAFHDDPSCRVCVRERWTELHHVVPRAQSGDDYPENLIALCGDCHRGVTENRIQYLMLLRWALTPAQRHYCVERKGAGWLEKKYPAVMSL